MDITKFVFDYRESAFLVGDYSTYRKQLSRRLRIVRTKLGRATTKNSKFQSKPPVTAEEVSKNVEYVAHSPSPFSSRREESSPPISDIFTCCSSPLNAPGPTP